MVTLTVAIALALILPAVIQWTPTTPPTPTAQPESPAQENLALAQASLIDQSRSAPTGQSSTQPAGSSPISGYRWTNASYAVGAVAPSYRSNPEMTWDAADGYVLLFGGNSVTGALETDTWTYLNGTWTNITSSVIGHPPPIGRAFMNYDPSTNSVILFGGYLLGVSYVNYTWSYHKDKWTNLTSTADGPPTSDFTSVASDPSDGELLAVVESNIEQTWTFKDGSWANITASAPPPLPPDSPSSVPFGLSPDPAEGGVLMLSEYQTVSGFFGATYLFKAGTWQNLTDQSPNAPLYPYGIVPWVADPLSYLPSATAVLFYETLSMNQIGLTFPFSETWMFSSGRWTNISGPAGAGPDPEVFAPSAGAVDPADSAFLTFGGISQVTSPSLLIPTWILSAPPVVNVSATPEATDVGLPVHLRGNVTFGLEPNNASWSFGDGSVATGLTATHTYTSAGLYQPSLTVSDLVNQSGSGSAALMVNPRPVPSFSFVPAQPIAGENVTFIGSVSGGTTPYSFAWNLGDGTTHPGAVVTHAYASEGSYLVNLTVTDSAGAVANMTTTVPVVPALSTPPPPVSSSNSTLDLTSGIGLALVLLVGVLAIAVAVLGVLFVRRRQNEQQPPATPPPPGAG